MPTARADSVSLLQMMMMPDCATIFHGCLLLIIVVRQIFTVLSDFNAQARWWMSPTCSLMIVGWDHQVSEIQIS
jgi:hypothetical protein